MTKSPALLEAATLLNAWATINYCDQCFDEDDPLSQLDAMGVALKVYALLAAADKTIVVETVKA